MEIERVKVVVLNSEHFLPFDIVDETAKAFAGYLEPEIEYWKG